MLCQTPACMQAANAMRQKALSSFQTAARNYEPHISRPEERELFQKLDRLVRAV